MGLLSVIIINYNTFKLTCNCIESIYTHTTGVSFEIILIDNASTECDPALFVSKFPGVKLICNEVNSGFAGGNNLGIKHSTGDVILLLNSDTELIEDSLSYCYNYIKSVGYPTVLTCKLVYPDQTLQFPCGRFPSIYLNILELLRIHKLLSTSTREQLFLSSYFHHEKMIEPDWIWGAFFMFNRIDLLKLPEQHLDDQFFMYCEDMKWCYDFKKTGTRISYLPGTKIIHHVGSSSDSNLKIKYITKNDLSFVRQTRGRLYKNVYAFIRAANFLSAFNRPGRIAAVNMLKNM